MLIRKKKTKSKQSEKKTQPAYDPNLGSGWVPRDSVSWMAPDWTREPLREGLRRSH